MMVEIATAQVQPVVDELRQMREQMATKADLQQLRQQMATKADLQQWSEKTVKWVFGALTAQTALLVALVTLLQ